MKTYDRDFATYVGFIHSVLVVVSSFESEICLEQALTIHGLLKKQTCPLHLLTPHSGFEECHIICKGTYTTKNELFNQMHCVGFKINFRLNDTVSSHLEDSACKIPECILEVLSFECLFSTNITHLNSNDTLSTNVQKNNEEDFCIAPIPMVLVNLSCAVVGCLLGIGGFLAVQRFRKYHERLDPTAVFFQPNYGDGGDIVAMTIPMEAEYAGIEDTIHMIAKAVQVPSYKDDSSSESRSRENIYHHLSLIGQSPKREKSGFCSIGSSPSGYSGNGRSSIKSEDINAEKLSSKSNASSKVSPTGSEGTGKYYALEKDYLNSNLNTENQ